MSLRVRVADGTKPGAGGARESINVEGRIEEDGTLSDFKSTSAGALPGYESAEIVYAVVDASRGAS